MRVMPVLISQRHMSEKEAVDMIENAVKKASLESVEWLRSIAEQTSQS